MSKGLVLSIFSGIDLLGLAFEKEGYCVVGFLDVIWGRDIRTFHPPEGVFNGVIGGDPCQSHSLLIHLCKAQGNEPRFPDLTSEFERVVEEAKPRWFLRENVVRAPIPHPQGYIVNDVVVKDNWVGGTQLRARRFCFGTPEGLKLEIEQVEGPASALVPVGHGIPPSSRRAIVADARRGRGTKAKPGMGGELPHVGFVLGIEEICEAMGLPRDFTFHMPFTMKGKKQLIGNGVTMASGLAVARSVSKTLK